MIVLQGLSLNLVRKFAVQILMCLYALSQSQVDGTQSATAHHCIDHTRLGQNVVKGLRC